MMEPPKPTEKTVYAMANAGEIPAFKIRGQWRNKIMSMAMALGVSACALDYAKEDGFFDRAQAKDMRTQVEETHECPPGKHWGLPTPDQCKAPKDCSAQCLDDTPRR